MYPTQEELEEIAHRTATRYRMNDECPYQYAAHNLIDFARRIIDWHTAKLVGQEPVGFWNGKETAYFEHELIDGLLPVGCCTIPLYTRPQAAQEWQPSDKLLSDLIEIGGMVTDYQDTAYEILLDKEASARRCNELREQMRQMLIAAAKEQG